MKRITIRKSGPSYPEGSLFWVRTGAGYTARGHLTSESTCTRTPAAQFFSEYRNFLVETLFKWVYAG